MTEQEIAGWIIGKDYLERIWNDKERKIHLPASNEGNVSTGFKGELDEVFGRQRSPALRELYTMSNSECRNRKRNKEKKGRKDINDFVIRKKFKGLTWDAMVVGADSRTA